MRHHVKAAEGKPKAAELKRQKTCVPTAEVGPSQSFFAIVTTYLKAKKGKLSICCCKRYLGCTSRYIVVYL